ncbi:acetyltransferase [Cladophialophora carrionii]|uniref:Acetyltransferase n=1 Tax=Cladophialophora carrionii TaxID=86049 RepID=A0A1C1CWK9_9EURO|nr:acetyltransferase [Cladophialophora carrionii]
MAFIRMYQDTDKDAMIHIFRETCAPDLIAAGDTVLHYASFLWCRPYLMLRPESCFVVDDGTGRAVGYLLGVPDTVGFVQEYREKYIPYLRSEGFEKPGPDQATGWDEHLPNALRQIMFNPEGMLHNDHPQMMEQWPAHLHIDLLDTHQRQGWGRQLIDRFCSLAKGQGAKGVHLGMAAANEDAYKFYTRVGFKRFPVVLDNGASGEEGQNGNTIWLVKTL